MKNGLIFIVLNLSAWGLVGMKIEQALPELEFLTFELGLAWIAGLNFVLSIAFRFLVLFSF